MKTPDKQIISMLQAFDQKNVLKAIKLYQQGVEDNFKMAEKQLREDDWYPVKEKPTDTESYFFNDAYWVQTEETRKLNREKLIAEMKEKQKGKERTPKKYTGQKMELKVTDISCPRCKGQMYKQGICTGCKEGKGGFKIRLICEDNPDHEILL